MPNCLSTYLDAVAQSLPHQHRKLVRGDLYLILLDWYTEGVPAKDAALSLSRALAEPSALAFAADRPVFAGGGPRRAAERPLRLEITAHLVP